LRPCGSRPVARPFYARHGSFLAAANLNLPAAPDERPPDPDLRTSLLLSEDLSTVWGLFSRGEGTVPRMNTVFEIFFIARPPTRCRSGTSATFARPGHDASQSSCPGFFGCPIRSLASPSTFTARRSGAPGSCFSNWGKSLCRSFMWWLPPPVGVLPGLKASLLDGAVSKRRIPL